DYGRLAHPPVIYSQERLKVDERLPAAQQFIRARKLNEVIAGDLADVGIIVVGGLTNGVLRALARLDLADLYGASPIPIYVLNVAFPLVTEELREFCAGKRAVLVVEEGSPDYIEQAVNVELRRADIATRVLGKGMLPRAGEYISEVLLNALASFLVDTRPARTDADAIAARAKNILAHKAGAIAAVGDIPAPPPNFCTRFPQRPIQRHQADAARARAHPLQRRHRLPFVRDLRAVQPAQFHPRLRHVARERGRGHPQHGPPPDRGHGRRGFWHNGLVTGVASNLFNKGDGVLIVMKNGYASATGQQYLPSSAANRLGAPTGMTVQQTLRSLGVKWLRTVRSYSVAKMTKTLKEAMRTAERGLKVIIADGECQLARQRRVRAEDAEKLKRGERVVRVRFGVDDEICTGD